MTAVLTVMDASVPLSIPISSRAKAKKAVYCNLKVEKTQQSPTEYVVLRCFTNLCSCTCLSSTHSHSHFCWTKIHWCLWAVRQEGLEGGDSAGWAWSWCHEHQSWMQRVRSSDWQTCITRLRDFSRGVWQVQALGDLDAWGMSKEKNLFTSFSCTTKL